MKETVLRNPLQKDFAPLLYALYSVSHFIWKIMYDDNIVEDSLYFATSVHWKLERCVKPSALEN